MKSWQLEFVWYLRIALILVVLALVYAVYASKDSSAPQLGFPRVLPEGKYFPEVVDDLRQLSRICVVAGVVLLGGWLLGKGARILPRDSHPILPLASAGMIFSAGVLSSLVWIDTHFRAVKPSEESQEVPQPNVQRDATAPAVDLLPQVTQPTKDDSHTSAATMGTHPGKAGAVYVKRQPVGARAQSSPQNVVVRIREQ